MSWVIAANRPVSGPKTAERDDTCKFINGIPATRAQRPLRSSAFIMIHIAHSELRATATKGRWRSSNSFTDFSLRSVGSQGWPQKGYS